LRRYFTRFAYFAGISGALFLLCLPWVERFGYDPDAIRAGEVWRLLTAHVTHLSANHAILNALGFGLAGAVLLQVASPRQLLFCVAGTVAVIDLVFLIPALQSDANFAGFSAILYGLAALAAVLLWVKRMSWGLLIASAVAAALVTDFLGWRSPGFEIATGTHVVGVVCGIFLGVYLINSPRHSALRKS